MVSAPTQELLFLGIDGGGTKCKASIADSRGQLLGSGTGGPANPLHGVARTTDSIAHAAAAALADAGLPPESMSRLVAGAGLAGVNLPSLHRVISQWQHPFAAWYLTTDLHIACLGAHQRDEGAVIVTGTGSCGYVRVKGTECMLGGHGFPFGDQGSGAWMGMEAIKAVLLAHDGLGPKTALTECIDRELNARGLAIVEAMAGKKSSEYARLAPGVFSAAEGGDEVARTILRAGADYVSALAGKLLEYEPPRLSIIGGMAERMRPWLAPDIAGQVAEPLGPPELGAVQYARLEYEQTETV